MRRVVDVATEFDELTNIVVGEAVDGQACRRCLLPQERCLLLGHQPCRDLLMSDLEVDTQFSQAGVKALALHVSLGDLETSRQIVGEDRKRHVIGQPQPSDLDEFRVSDARGLDGVPDVLIESTDGESSSRRRRYLAGLGDVLIEAAECFVTPES